MFKITSVTPPHIDSCFQLAGVKPQPQPQWPSWGELRAAEFAKENCRLSGALSLPCLAFNQKTTR